MNANLSFIETASRSTIRQIQLERLQATLNRIYRHVKYYHQAFDRLGVLPDDIQSLDDVARLPFTRRDDLLMNQPYDMFAVPLRDVVRLHPAAGAGGPVVVGYTQNDVETWARMAARALGSAGVSQEDVIAIALDYTRDAAALGTQSGAERIGASVLPCAGLAPDRQIELMRYYRATVLVATPSQALQLSKLVQNMVLAEVSWCTALIIGEVWSVELRAEIEAGLHVKAYGSYGLSEMAVPGLATECNRHEGLHLSEGDLLAETIDPNTGEVLPLGEPGELVLTTLTREAVPLMRYRTGDITALHNDPCVCGRTTLRMDPAHSRSDDVLIVSGTRVSPAQIEEIVDDIIPGALCRIDISDADSHDDLDLLIGIKIGQFEDPIRRMQRLRERLQEAIYENLGLRTSIRLVEPSHIQKTMPTERS